MALKQKGLQAVYIPYILSDTTMICKHCSSENVVKKCINRVIELQIENEAWTSIDGERYTVSTTINVLRVLKMYRV